MQKAIKWSKIIAWIGIILNVILLFILFILYNDYLDASWVGTVLNILYPFAFIAEIMMFGGIFVKAILEYKSGVRPTKRDLIIILVAVAVVVIYYTIKLYFIK
jgi:preprotein translocase subunit SecE